MTHEVKVTDLTLPLHLSLGLLLIKKKKFSDVAAMSYMYVLDPTPHFAVSYLLPPFPALTELMPCIHVHNHTYNSLIVLNELT